MTASELAVLGGQPVRTRAWPVWPQATPSAVAAVTDVLGSRRWTLSGAYDGRVCYERRFAAAFADFTGTPHCTPTSSGTAALMVALQAVGVGPGDEVLVPGLTWVACASAVSNLDAVPVLVDIEPDSLAMSAQRAREAITPRTAAIMVVHLFCGVADLDAFVELAADHGLPLVEDCAQAHGARWRGRPVGSWGAAGCFSMQQSKLLTCGEGGAVVTGDAEIHDRAEQLRCDGRRFAAASTPGQLELVEVGDVQGRNFCLSELHAAVLLDGLGRLREQNAWRADRAAELDRLLAGVDGVSMLPADPRVSEPTYYNLVLRLEPERFAHTPVEVVAGALKAELGTAVNPVYVPLDRHRLLRPIDTGGPLPGAEQARRTCLTLTHPVLLDTPDGMRDVAEALDKVARNASSLAGVGAPQPAQAF